jgi:enterobactin synthetase component D
MLTDGIPDGRWVASPFQFSGPVAHASMVFMAGTDGKATRLEAKRKQHVASRLCATRVLLEAGAADTVVDRGDDRCPVWPQGFVGSLTHTRTFVAAAAAAAKRVRSLGLDSEQIVYDDESSAITQVCCSHQELRTLAVWPMHPRCAVTLLFSAKEALFKCINPVVLEFFDFVDAEVACIDARRRTISIRLCRPLGTDFAAGQTFEGRYAFAFGHVHTCFEILDGQQTVQSVSP